MGYGYDPGEKIEAKEIRLMTPKIEKRSELNEFNESFSNATSIIMSTARKSSQDRDSPLFYSAGVDHTSEVALKINLIPMSDSPLKQDAYLGSMISHDKISIDLYYE